MQFDIMEKLVGVYDLRKNCWWDFFPMPFRDVQHVSISPDGYSIYFLLREARANSHPRSTLVCFDRQNRTVRWRQKLWPISNETPNGSIKHLQNLPGGHLLACSASDGTIRIFEALTGLERTRFRDKPGAFNSLVPSTDGRWLYSVHPETGLTQWDLFGAHAPRQAPLHPSDGPALLAILEGSDGHAIEQAIRRCVQHPEVARAMLKEWQIDLGPSAQEVRRWRQLFETPNFAACEGSKQWNERTTPGPTIEYSLIHNFGVVNDLRVWIVLGLARYESFLGPAALLRARLDEIQARWKLIEKQ
ncbi:MAG: hypothetical protein ACRCZF_21135 [Gemmataceae bacterium]